MTFPTAEGVFECGDLKLQKGGTLKDARIVYKTYGTLSAAGDNVIVSLADGSIRDFLEIMGEIYEAFVLHHRWDPKSPANLSRFVNFKTQILPRIQTTGIYSASDSYYEGVSHRSEIDTDVISRLIAGLGIYTSLLQTNPADPTTLSTVERGVFFVDYSNSFGPDGLISPATIVAPLRPSRCPSSR